MNISNHFKSDFFRNSATLLSANVIAQIIPIIIYPIITRQYSPSQLGILSVFLSISGILAVLSTGRYEFAILLPRDDKTAQILLSISVFISISFSIVLLLFIVLFNTNIAAWLHEPQIKPWLYIIPFSVFMSGLYQAFSYFFNRHKDYKSIGVYGISQGFVSSGLKLVFGYAGYTSFGLIIATFIGQLASIIFFIYKALKKFGTKIIEVRDVILMKKVAVEYSSFPKFRMFHAFTNTFSGSLPFFILTSFSGAEVAGFFSLCMAIVFRPVNLFTSSIGQVLSRNCIERMQQKQSIEKYLKKLILIISVSFLPIFICFSIFSVQIVSFIFGKQWVESGRYLRYLMPWLYFVMLYSLLSFLPDLVFKQKQALLVDILYLFMRLASLFVGLYFFNIYNALLFFSLSGVIILAGLLLWYFSIAKEIDRNIIYNQNIPLPINYSPKPDITI
jgi:O-antigen/teichoic acid export membrane protein